MDRWEDEGFAPVHQMWLFRAADLDKEFSFENRSKMVEGTMIGLDDNGGLMLRADGGVRGYSLVECALRTMESS
jgi:BirA family biotin operon repressor/biotin-[acetyl-CoA-carboxylase] ligase